MVNYYTDTILLKLLWIYVTYLMSYRSSFITYILILCCRDVYPCMCIFVCRVILPVEGTCLRAASVARGFLGALLQPMVSPRWVWRICYLPLYSLTAALPARVLLTLVAVAWPRLLETRISCGTYYLYFL